MKNVNVDLNFNRIINRTEIIRATEIYYIVFKVKEFIFKFLSKNWLIVWSVMGRTNEYG